MILEGGERAPGGREGAASAAGIFSGRFPGAPSPGRASINCWLRGQLRQQLWVLVGSKALKWDLITLNLESSGRQALVKGLHPTASSFTEPVLRTSSVNICWI